MLVSAGWSNCPQASERVTYKSSSKPRARFLSGPVSLSICLYLLSSGIASLFFFFFICSPLVAWHPWFCPVLWPSSAAFYSLNLTQVNGLFPLVKVYYSSGLTQLAQMLIHTTHRVFCESVSTSNRLRIFSITFKVNWKTLTELPHVRTLTCLRRRFQGYSLLEVCQV